MYRVFRYRLYPTRAQERRMFEMLGMLRELYNAALQERREAWQKQRVSLTKYDQQKAIPEIRAVRPEFNGVLVEVLRDPLARLDRAFQAFFRRVKAGQTPGFPRFQGRDRYRTFSMSGTNGAAKIVSGGKRVRIAGVGNVRFKQHRAIEGRIKLVSVTVDAAGHWHVAFCCDDVPARTLPPTGATVGVDVGISSFAALSNGETVENPKFYETSLRGIKTAQRRVSRRKKGSRRRRKAVTLLARQHDKVSRSRLDFHHKVARNLVDRFDVIHIEELNVQGLARSRLAKQVTDAAWGQFATVLRGKAESAGREVVAVDPRGTSQICSRCGCEVRKSLAVRVHRCPHCGYTDDRDVNAARNIQRRGQRHRGEVSSRRLDEARTTSP